MVVAIDDEAIRAQTADSLRRARLVHQGKSFAHLELDGIDFILVDGIIQTMLGVGGVNGEDFYTSPYILKASDLIEAHLKPLLAKGESASVLHLGVGAGSLVKLLSASVAGLAPNTLNQPLRQFGVDLNAELVDYARAAFDLPRSPAFKFNQADAFEYLAAQNNDRFDAVMVDLFNGLDSPAALFKPETARELLRVSKPGGQILFNLVDDPTSKLNLARIVKNFSALGFANVEIIKLDLKASGHTPTNFLLVVTK